MDKEKEYQKICEKLGSNPLDIKIPDFETEDDTWVSPISKLSVEEIDFLYKNGYLNKK